MLFQIDDLVKIRSFCGTKVADDDVNDSENYWKLIGLQGRIIQIRNSSHPAFPEKGNQVLVQFDKKDVNSLDLYIHNSIENALWMFQSDLECV